jgi:hypothetical protein
VLLQFLAGLALSGAALSVSQAVRLRRRQG